VVGISPAAAGHSDDMERVGETRREIVEHVRGILEAGHEYDRLSLAAPIDDFDANAARDSHPLCGVGRWVVPRDRRRCRGRRALIFGARSVATATGSHEEKGEAKYAWECAHDPGRGVKVQRYQALADSCRAPVASYRGGTETR
jgi:hypothetical protein